MKYMSFGADAGHLMNRLLQHAGVSEAMPMVVEVQPEADEVALELLREAAEGGWLVELLDAEDDPDTGEGLLMVVRQVDSGQICGDSVDETTGRPDGGWLRLALRQVEKVHLY